MEAIEWHGQERLEVFRVYRTDLEGNEHEMWHVTRSFADIKPYKALIGCNIGRTATHRYFIFFPPHKTLTELKTNIRIWRTLYRAAS